MKSWRRKRRRMRKRRRKRRRKDEELEEKEEEEDKKDQEEEEEKEDEKEEEKEEEEDEEDQKEEEEEKEEEKVGGREKGGERQGRGGTAQRTKDGFAALREMACDAVIIGDSIVGTPCATAAKGKVHTRCLPGARVLDVSAQVPCDPEEEHRSCGPPCWHERHRAEADGDPEEGLQEPGGEGTHHIAHDEDHRVRTTSHVPAGKVESVLWACPKSPPSDDEDDLCGALTSEMVEC
ncbi:hypothetical protein QTP86_031033, partial [Hemibagrus guttatus]